MRQSPIRGKQDGDLYARKIEHKCFKIFKPFILIFLGAKDKCCKTCGFSMHNYRRLHLPVNALSQNMFSCDVKRLRFRCQTLKSSRPNVKLYFSTLLKGKRILINKKRRNYQKGVTISTICTIRGKNLHRIILSQKLGEDQGAVSKIVKHYTSHLDEKTSKFDT